MTSTIAIIQNCAIYLDTTHNERVLFLADADIDCDGGSNPFHDPYWQSDTSYHHEGKAIDAETVPYVVVPLVIIREARGAVLGCLARATNVRTGQQSWAIVADVGPQRKIGEVSPALAKRIGVNPDPIIGGEEEHIIQYEIWPGMRATIDGVKYELQPWKR